MKVGQTVVAGEGADILPGNALPAQGDPRRHHDPQPRAPRRARAGSSCAAPAPPRSSWRRKATTPRSSCPRARCARSTPTAWPPSARSATSTTRTSRSARPAASAGSGGGRTTAASSMNPIDHPHGGGEGRTSGGRHPVTPWGKPTKGAKTRNNKRTAAVHRQEAEVSHGTIAEEGAVRGRPPDEEGGGDERGGGPQGHQDLVPPLDDHPRDGRPHPGRLQRQEVRPGLRDGEHGRAQARRVLPDPAVQGATPRRSRRWPRWRAAPGRRRRRRRRRPRA